jgi:hypothetical protein
MLLLDWFKFFLFLYAEDLQTGNRISVLGVCRFISCILRNKKLTKVYFEHRPSACVGRDAWRRENLPVPPREVVKKGYWRAIILFIRVRCACVAVASHVS